MENTDDHSWLKLGSTSSAEVKEIYDDWAASYDETLKGWDYRAPTQAATYLRAQMPSNAAILDVGCGTGLTGAALRAAGFTGPIDGVDLSPDSLKEAKKLNVYSTLDTANLQTLPLSIADDAYDALICIGVLTYVPDSDSVLREFARMVRPGGRVLVTQRDDVFHERAFGQTAKALTDVFSDVAITDPQPYLPDNPDFGAAIKVIYVMMTVA
ncbi:MAG: class I SAM-dependent methyltransferase [Rhodospirillaceae bacterium]|jgi:predicted TPR repeat methyltransferase|nr:class I SAM-dependent methyltransferase [Rhodospirillaceae bacterium]MBT5667328.1 class I SAM-dependent methyltransferase [Rhodospirillaceae bacterium]MBT5812236.1 class I SAM-dependent methyltransferase [Rhodospirillaceae bacterium]